ncbi:MAG: pyruvate formate-lyase-activating protein [Sphaerochaeta sp.]|jgi:pyruvate formate lyase activating enzyme
MSIVGNIHSIETLGTLDGPGLRYVLFLQGCSLRCRYCHNPDTWSMKGGSQRTVADLVEEIKGYRSFITTGGGVTISGGEPLRQPEFTLALIKALKAEGIHTAIDTAGSVPLEISREVLDEVDLVLLDIKSLDDRQAFSLTGMGNANTLATLAYCQSIGKDVWIRHVLVPGWTLEEQRLDELADFLTNFDTVVQVELLPYHSMGAYKWEQLKLNYPFEDVPAPTASELVMARSVFAAHGIDVLMTDHSPQTKETKVS